MVRCHSTLLAAFRHLLIPPAALAIAAAVCTVSDQSGILHFGELPVMTPVAHPSHLTFRRRCLASSATLAGCVGLFLAYEVSGFGLVSGGISFGFDGSGFDSFGADGSGFVSFGFASFASGIIITRFNAQILRRSTLAAFKVRTIARQQGRALQFCPFYSHVHLCR